MKLREQSQYYGNFINQESAINFSRSIRSDIADSILSRMWSHIR